MIIINFTPIAYEDFLQKVTSNGIYSEIFNSDDIKFGGSGVVNCGKINSENTSDIDDKCEARLRIPPLGITILQRENI